MNDEALCGLLVLGEIPYREEVGQERRKAALWPLGKSVGPTLLRDLRRVTFGYRPSARRIHDQRSLALHEVLVVSGIVPGCDLRRQPLDQLLVVFERLPHLVGLHREVALPVDEMRAE